jgi:nitrous-oxide reductase
LRGVVYYLPTPKSPHGVDVDPTGEYIVAGGKLATVIPVHSFTKLQKAIADKAFDKTIDGIPVLKYDAVMAGEVQKPGSARCTPSSTARATRTRRCSSRPKS